VRIAFWGILIFALAVPALLAAIALGPVIVGVLCAVGFGLVVFLIANAILGLGAAARWAGRTASRSGR